MNKKYTHLFFDLDNTLWDFKANSYLALESAYKKYIDKSGHGFLEFNTEYNKNNSALWQKYRQKEVAKKELVNLRFSLTCEALKIDFKDFEEINAFYLEQMALQETLSEGAFDVLEQLKKKGFKLYIITNGFTEVQYKKLKNSGIRDFFEKVFVSEEIEAPKPSKEIFEHAIKSANAPKKSSIMIGDDWESDIMGALRFGIDAVYFNPGVDRCIKIVGKHKVFIISSLFEISLI